MTTSAFGEAGDPGTRPADFDEPTTMSESSLEPYYTTTGQITLSLDALGTTAANGTIHVDKPQGGTVRAAFLMVASTGYSSATIADGEVLLEGTPVFWDDSIPSTIFSWNYLSDVTDIVGPVIDQAPPGIVSLDVSETTRTWDIDGSVIAVVFDVPTLTRDYTVVLFFGAQHIDGDDFAIGLNEPARPDDPDYVLDLSLGISFGWQGYQQSSLIDINGTRMTSSAGGQDDGEPYDGALITVGGIGDSNANPSDPYSGPNGDPRQDDELYDLKPFVVEGDMLINVHTVNPSDDDNIFFAGLVTSGRVGIVGDIEIVDANPADLEHDVTQYDVVAEDVCDIGTIRSQTSCDGTSRLLIRLAADEPGNVVAELSDQDHPTGLGSIAPLNSEVGGTTAEAHTVETSRGHMAFFVYTPPDAMYADDPQFDASSREIGLTMDFEPDGGGDVQGRVATMTLRRPPVLLVHGLNSSPRAWSPQIWGALESEWGFGLQYADYEATANQSLETNFGELADRCEELIARYHEEGIACSQIDVVGHSMGGLLARRWHADSDNYWASANYQEGWINLLVTVDTPHHGSEMADRFQLIHDDHPWCYYLLTEKGGLNYGTAIPDLMTTSENILALGATNVPAHAIVGEGGTDDFADSHGEEAALVDAQHWLVCGDLVTTDIFGDDAHDFVVSSPSQRGGLASGNVTTNTSAAGEHTACLGEDAVFDQTRDLLLAGATASNLASGFPVPTVDTDGVPAGSFGDDIVLVEEHTIPVQPCGTLLEPAPGAVLQPGSSVTVRAEFGAEVEVAWFVSKTGPDIVLDPDTWTGTLVIPDDFAGDVEYRLIGGLGDHTLCASEPVLLQVQPTAQVQELYVQPTNVILDRPAVATQLNVTALFDDGFYRPANSPIVGTAYFSYNTGVATVDERGSVVSTGPGITSIVVENGSLQRTVRIVVGDAPANVDPLAIIQPPGAICAGDTVCFDGSGSHDPDADPDDVLSLAWDLNGDGNFDDAFDPVPCAVYLETGAVLVSLQVVDRYGSTAIDTVTIVVEACAPEIEGVEPSPATPGQDVRVYGQGFGADPGAGQYDTDTENVTIGGDPIPSEYFVSWADDAIVFTLPTGFSSGPLQVTAGGRASNTVEIEIIESPECAWSEVLVPFPEPTTSYGVAWGDFDDDGDPDAFVANDGPNHLLVNEDGVLVLDPDFPGGDRNSRSALWGDLDDDGDLDLYVVNRDQANRVLRNDDGAFVDITSGPEGDTGPGYNAAFADVDNDGDLDLYIVNSGGSSRLLRDEGGAFVHVAGPTDVDGISRGCAFADYDNDGDQDLYVSRVGDNKLFVNDGHGVFVENTPSVIADTGSGKSAAWGDYDNDGWLDLMLVNSMGANHLYRNDGGMDFVEVDAPALAATAGGRSCVWADFDNDGWLDLFLTSVQAPNRLLKNIAGEFTEITCGSLVEYAELASWGCSPADYDGDGDLDLFVAMQGSASPSLIFRNDLYGSQTGWLTLDLDGTASNSSGIGARIDVDTGSRMLVREVGAGTYLSQAPYELTIGVGSATLVDVVVTWPSGTVQRLENVATDQRIVVTEGSTPTAIEDLPIPESFFVRNYPNPFNPSTVIAFGLPEANPVTLQIYDLRGRLVRSLRMGELHQAGCHDIKWLGRDDQGNSVSSGIYVFRLVAGAHQASGRMTLLK